MPSTLTENGALTTPILSYLYKQYADDADLQAFVSTYNSIAQGYLDWFNANPLALYTNSNISGALLDWVMNGIYGIYRPGLTTGTDVTIGPVGTVVIATEPVGVYFSTTTNTTFVDDDIFKRYATWILYQGDGVQMTVQWLLRRINRFVYGTYGSDVSLDTLQNIGLEITGGTALITVPSVSGSDEFSALLANNSLPLPMQIKFTIAVEMAYQDGTVMDYQDGSTMIYNI